MTAFDELRMSLDDTLADGRTIDIFFRDDDADDDLPNLHRLLDLFGAHATPIHLAVIPGTLTDRGADVLLRRHDHAPHLIELGQHGWMHSNHEIVGRKCEFGPSRNYELQLADIARGRDLLDGVFGPAWQKIFTPPWNRCDENTLQALDCLDFQVLSADGSQMSPQHHRFCEIPISFDIFIWKKGTTPKTASDIGFGIGAQVRRKERIGILLHHKVMTPDAFRAIDILLDGLAESAAVRLHTLHNLATKLLREESTVCHF